jgi:hypothetical protein
MAEGQFTEAGKAGQRIRGALANAYRGLKSGFTNYVQEPLLNLYPQVIANPTYAATEAVAGAFDVPLNLGRHSYYDIETENERNERLLRESEPPEPAATLANRDLNSEYYGGPDNVPQKKAIPVTKKLYRVMYAGKGAESSEVYETKEEADAALKKAGGKGAVAGIDFSRKAKDKSKVSNRNYLKGELGDKLSADETEARKQKYIDQLDQTKMDKMVYDEQLKRAKSPEYKAALQERGRLANEAKLAEDKQEGRDFAKWKSGVRVRRESQNVLNDFNRETGLLKNAYNQALQSNKPLAALQLSRAIRKRESGIPKEMGARKKFFEEDAVRRRDAYLAEVERQAQEEERINRLYSANPDARDFR